MPTAAIEYLSAGCDWDGQNPAPDLTLPIYEAGSSRVTMSEFHHARTALGMSFPFT